jgi:PAS domain S-box-containing protein
MRSAETLFSNTSMLARPTWQRYGVAIAAVLLGWIAREALTQSVGPTSLPFIFFFPAVAASAWFGGLGPGVLSMLLSAAMADWFFIRSTPGFAFSNIYDVAAIAAFLAACLFIVAAIYAMHRADADRARVQRQLGTTLASIGDAVIATDIVGRITFINSEAERLTGWKSADAIGKSLASVFHIVNEVTRQTAENPVDEVLHAGKTVGLANHTILIARDGTEIPIDDSAAPIRSADGATFGVVMVFRDVAEQRTAQVARARLAAIVEFSGDAIITKDLDGIVQTWNASAERILGYTAAEMVRQPITRIIPPDRLDEEPQILARLRSGLSYERLETVRVAKDGHHIPVSLSVSPLKDRDGHVVGASKIIHDITEIVAAREALKDERELLATTLSSIGDGVIVTDADSRVTFLNPEAESLTGWTQSEAEGMPLPAVFRIVNEETRKEAENPVDKVFRTGVVVGLANHTLLIGKDGIERPIDDSAAPIRHSGGSLFGVVLVFRDFTSRRLAERALHESRQKLQEEALRKDEFLAILSHELRNPLAPIRMAVSVLNKIGARDPQLQQIHDIIDRQTTQLTRLLDDLMDVGRISSGKITLRKARFDIALAVSNAVESIRPQVDLLQHELVIDLPPVPIYIDGDITRLAQVFVNLLSNAVRYTNKGGRIRLIVRREQADAVIRVIDPGIGISPDQMSRIFEMFAQVDQSLERGQDGLGVGLALTRTLVELHGGTVEAKSEGLGKGSEFIVRIPAVPAQREQVQSPEGTTATAQKPRRVLIADDNVDSATVLAILLRASGHEVQTVHDGMAALESSKSFRPDLVILDIGMPKVNGYDVARQIRSRGDSHVTLVAITGWGQEEDKRRARESGFDQHLTKPVDVAALERLLAEMR